MKTPRMDELVRSGIELDRAYSYQFCSPTRSSLQSGRYPTHVNDKNMDVTVHNPSDPMSGFAGIPRNMTGIASKLKQAGYLTHQVGKVILVVNLPSFVNASLARWSARHSTGSFVLLLGLLVVPTCVFPFHAASARPFCTWTFFCGLRLLILSRSHENVRLSHSCPGLWLTW